MISPRHDIDEPAPATSACQCAQEVHVSASDAVSADDIAGTATQHRRFPWWKAVLSLWIVYHLAGIVIAPASVPPSSDIVRNSWRLVGPYLQFLYLNHGFHFFAPDPGPSTIVRYVADLPDGTSVVGQIPDKQAMRPRLLYHRHFMLTEFLAASDDMDPNLQPLHVRALARQVARQHGADAVTLSRVSHMLPAMEWCRSGLSLEDAQLYEEQPIGRFQWADF
ncbi:MAG: hypothetical protein KDA75_04130 [Planctomycetaceae bacterium]|nr:hypothetical protein [Planctomycetaceae bacterium]